VEEIPHKSPSLFTGRQQLGQQISLIVMGVDIASLSFVIGHVITDKFHAMLFDFFFNVEYSSHLVPLL
jgi:hypothetical protein